MGIVEFGGTPGVVYTGLANTTDMAIAVAYDDATLIWGRIPNGWV